MVRISKIMLQPLDDGKYLKLDEFFLYGLLCNLANTTEKRTVEDLTLNWFCTALGIERTERHARTIGEKMRKIESLGLIKISRPQNVTCEGWAPYKYEVIYPTHDYELISISFFWRKGLTAEAKGLALGLSTLAYRGTNKISYTDVEICKRLHITRPTFKKYEAELEQANIINKKVLSADFFPLVITNAPLKAKLLELRMYDGEYFQRLLDWFEETFLSLPPSTKLNDLGLKVLRDIEWGKFKREKVEEQLKEYKPIILD